MNTLKLHHGGCTLAAHDLEFVTRLMEGAGESLRLRGEIAMLPHWIQALTESVQRSHPALCLSYTRGLVGVAKYGEAETAIQEAEHWLENNTQAGDPGMDSLRGKALALRAQFAHIRFVMNSLKQLSWRSARSNCCLSIMYRGAVGYR